MGDSPASGPMYVNFDDAMDAWIGLPKPDGFAVAYLAHVVEYHFRGFAFDYFLWFSCVFLFGLLGLTCRSSRTGEEAEQIRQKERKKGASSRCKVTSLRTWGVSF